MNAQNLFVGSQSSLIVLVFLLIFPAWTSFGRADDEVPFSGFCKPPADVVLRCTDYEARINFYDIQELQNTFGKAKVAAGVGGVYIEERPPLVDINQCGVGTVHRRFQSFKWDDPHQPVEECSQLITIKDFHHYQIRFPADAEAVCSAPEPEGLAYYEIGCDLLAVNTSDQRLQGTGEECYKIFRTHQVINWCEYDGHYPEEPWDLYRDFDDNGKPGDKPFWLIRTAGADHQGDSYGQLFIDDDRNLANGFYTDEPLDKVQSRFFDLPDVTEPSRKFYNRAALGYYSYVQIIKVYDDEKPAVEFGDLAPFCSFSNAVEDGCPGEVVYPFTVTDSCSPNGSVSVELDPFLSGNLAPLDGALSGEWPNFQVQGTFPQGSHRFVVTARDNCGNLIKTSIPFSVVDCKGPAPICIEGLSLQLMPDSLHAGVGLGEVSASDFIASPVTDCNGQDGVTVTDFSINLVPDVVPDPQGRDVVDRDRKKLVFTCADTGLVFVEIHAWDSQGNHDWCETTIDIQDNQGLACTGQASPLVHGQVVNASGQGMADVNILLTGDRNAQTVTDAEGNFELPHLPPGGDYRIRATYEDDALRGVSSLDMLILYRHILQIAPIADPFLLLAADVNADGKTSTFDLVQMQKTILGYTDTFPGNSAWRVAPADFKARDIRLFSDDLPVEVDRSDRMPHLQLVAIKVGDLSGDAMEAEPRSSQPSAYLETADRMLRAGDRVRLPIYGNAGQWVAAQGRLRIDPDQLQVLRVLPGQLLEKSWNDESLAAGILPMAWYREHAALSRETPLFHLDVAVRRNGRAATALQLQEATVWQEDHQSRPLEFRTTPHVSGAVNLKVQPNPVRSVLRLEFELPEDRRVQIRLSDLEGRVVRATECRLPAGQHTEQWPVDQLPAGTYQISLIIEGAPVHQLVVKQ